MTVLPVSEVKSLAECEPGQLVRSLEYGEATRVGVVFSGIAEEPERRGIVSFQHSRPVFEIEDDPEDVKVLAHAGKVVWEIDQTGPVETNAQQLFGKAGIAICHAGGWVLNVAPTLDESRGRFLLQLNLQTWELMRYKERLKRVASFGSWSLYLEELNRPIEHRWKVFDFRIDAGA